MPNNVRHPMLDAIRANIVAHGHHLTSVMAGQSPRYLYTIGLLPKIGAELVLAGIATIPLAPAAQVLNCLAKKVKNGEPPRETKLEIPGFGHFVLGRVHQTWVERLLLGALDYYDLSELKVWQVLPNQEQGTIDVPSMAFPYSSSTDPVWRWLEEDWPYDPSPETLVLTNISALQGGPITEVGCWEPMEWEMFSGATSTILESEMMPAPLSTLLAHDPSLKVAFGMKPQTSIHRTWDHTGPGPWQPRLR